jgi:hypothetical protein
MVFMRYTITEAWCFSLPYSWDDYISPTAW